MSWIHPAAIGPSVAPAVPPSDTKPMIEPKRLMPKDSPTMTGISISGAPSENPKITGRANSMAGLVRNKVEKKPPQPQLKFQPQPHRPPLRSAQNPPTVSL